MFENQVVLNVALSLIITLGSFTQKPINYSPKCKPEFLPQIPSGLPRRRVPKEFPTIPANIIHTSHVRSHVAISHLPKML